MITRNFNLNLYAGHSSPLVINVNQYDHGEQWLFTLYNEDGTQYVPSTGAIVGIKSDGLGIINTGSVVDGKVVINETQQMTAAVGKATFELTLDSQTHGTANFVVLVEPKPGDNASLSESDLSLIQEALNATSPLPTGGTVGQVLTKTANGSTWSDAGTPTQAQVAEAVADWADENITVSTGVVIDQSLSVQGAAADAKKTGDEISALKSQISDIEEQIEGGTGGGITAKLRQALLQLAQKVAYVDDDGQSYYDDLYDALYEVTAISLNTNSITLQSIGATQQLTATTTPEGGAVTWTSSDETVATVDSTGLVTSVAYGTATITATAGSATATCSVLIAQATVTSISAVYTQSGIVYDDVTLDSLKSDLVVTANWSDETTSTLADSDYTLSGTLTEGASAVTVSYGGQTTTFSVTVTAKPEGLLYSLVNRETSNERIDTGVALLETDQSFTLMFDADITANQQKSRFIWAIESADPWHGVALSKYNGSDRVQCRFYDQYSNASATFPTKPFRIRIVATHTAGDGQMVIKIKYNSGKIETVTRTGTVKSIPNTFNVNDATTNYGFTGTVRSAYIYNKVIDASEITAYFGD